MDRPWRIIWGFSIICLVQLGSVAVLGETENYRQKALDIASNCVRSDMGDSLYESSVELVGGGWSNEFYRADFYFRSPDVDEYFIFSVLVAETGECVDEPSYMISTPVPYCARHPEWCEVGVSRAQADSIVTSLGLEPFPNGVYSSDNRREVSLGVGSDTRRIVWKAVKAWPIGNGRHAIRVVELGALQGEVLVDYADTVR